jgi:hypothetical protein
MSDRPTDSDQSYRAPQGAINEAIATLDAAGRSDLGTAVKRLWELRNVALEAGRR